MSPQPSTPQRTRAFDSHERRMWAGRAQAYAVSFAPLCAYTVPLLLGAVGLDAAGSSTGRRPTLLDAGCGTGAVSVMAAARGADVVCVDAEPSMLTMARDRVPRAHAVCAALPALPLSEGHFDAVVANFVLNHVADPLASTESLGRQLRPGGRLAVTAWPDPPSALHALWGRVLDAAEIEPPRDLPRVPPELDFARTRQGLADLLRRAGLGDVCVMTVHWLHRVHIDQWWNGPSLGVATIGTVVSHQSPDAIRAIETHYRAIAQEYCDDQGMLALPTCAHLGLARRV